MRKPDKSFRTSVRLDVHTRQNGKCARCGKDLNRAFGSSCHHKKRRSQLRKDEIENHGPGGGADNAVWLCAGCHMAVHQRRPGTERFRTWSWQEIGETEVDA